MLIPSRGGISKLFCSICMLLIHDLSTWSFVLISGALMYPRPFRLQKQGHQDAGIVQQKRSRLCKALMNASGYPTYQELTVRATALQYRGLT